MSGYGREALELLVGCLALVPQPRFRTEREIYVIRVLPDDGYVVELRDEGPEATVLACSWWGHFHEPDEAVNMVMSLLSPYARIVEEFRGDQLLSTWVESYGAEGWVGGHVRVTLPEESLIAPSAPVWQVRSLQDTVRPLVPYTERVPGANLQPGGLPPGVLIGREWAAVL